MYQPSWNEQEPKEPQPAREPNQMAISSQPYNALLPQKEAEQQEPQPAREPNQMAISPQPYNALLLQKEAEQQEPQPARGTTMAPRFGIWWQKIRQYPVMTTAIIIVGVLVAALIVVVVLGYWFNWPWVGVNGGVSKITRTSQGTNIEYSSGKTFWDWLGLLGVLAIPVVVGFGGAWFTRVQQKRDQEAANRRAEDEQKIATDNQRETALQAYIDKMSELLLVKQLRNSGPKDEVCKVARVRTLTVLPGLDGKRKGSVLQFLYESGLISKDPSIIDLNGADLSEADLKGANLSEANLSKANLSKAHLSEANLLRAELKEADLKEAILSEAILDEAKLSEAIMSGANLREAHLSKANLDGANLDGADLSEARLYEAKLSRGAKLHRANLSRADLNYVDLSRAELKEADLSGVEDLKKAKLNSADLSRAILFGTDFSRADLTEANLSGAKYNTKVMQGEDTQGNRVTLKPTQWPPDFDLKNKGAICVDC